MKLRLAAALAAGFLTIAVLALGSTYWAARRVPEFYQEVLQAEPAALKQNSDQLLENAAAWQAAPATKVAGKPCSRPNKSTAGWRSTS